MDASTRKLCNTRASNVSERRSSPSHGGDHDVEQVIRELRVRNIRLGVISNGFAEDVHPWPTWSLAREFESRVFSCEAGLAKPDPEIYRKAMRELGVEPATTCTSATVGTMSSRVRSEPAFARFARRGLAGPCWALLTTLFYRHARNSELTCVEDGESLRR